MKLVMVQSPVIKIRVSQSSDIVDSIHSMFDYEQIDIREEFIAVYLNRANFTIGYSQISIGSDSGTVVDVKRIITKGLLSRASSIIVAHNHPSGNLKPSTTDINITRKLKSACETVELSLLDHIIIGPNSQYDGSYFSFADEGLI